MKTQDAQPNTLQFTSSLDLLAKILTWGFGIVPIVIILIQYYYAFDSAIPVFFIISMFLIYVFSFLYAPRSYRITKNEIIIQRYIQNKKIQISNIVKVELIEKEMISNAWRIFGVGGLFGYYGLFYNSQMGTMRFYATRTAKAVLICTKNHNKIILTPDQPEAFLDYFKALK